MPGSWQPLKNKPNVNIDAMLLLTDGAVMCHEYLTSNWFRLVPDDHSDYANGTWIPLSPMPNNAPPGQNGPANAPLYFASAVLRDGTMFCAGGEDNGAYNQFDLLAAEIYDPTTDTWTAIATPPKWTNIGDGASCVLPDGRVILGCAVSNFDSNATAIWDPESGSWSAGGDGLDPDSEEGWTLLPDGTVLAVQCTNVPDAQKYVIASNSWVPAGNTGATLPADPVNVPPVIYEMGPQILLPDGRVFAIGASGHTALYTPPTTTPTDPGSWAAGPDFPVDAHGNLKGAVDAPACLLPNGNVLCCVGAIALAGPDTGFSTPAEFYEFDPISGTLIPAPAPAIAGISPTYNCRLLILPTGQAILSACSDGGASFDMAIYTPAGGPRNAWRPEITHVPRRLHAGQTYRLHGRQLNGLSQACAYGDDQQMATNYPLVRLWGPHHVGAVYCRTFDHSTMGVATGHAIHHTHFAVPDHLPHGEYRLTVIANGISSHPVDVRVESHRHHSHGYDHDGEIVEFDHEESKYKDKDAKEAKEKEKDFKDVKEKDTKEFKDKDKDCKECEEKPCKEKDHKECEHKGCKEKECHEHMHYAHHEKRHELGELMRKVGHIAEVVEHLEGELHRRPFIRGEERPDVGERALRQHEFERHEGERREHEQREEEHRLDAEQHRRMEQERLQEEERRRHEEERHGAETRRGEVARRVPENPAAPHESTQRPRTPGGPKKR